LRKAAGIIPARFQSSRFPGKPLALIQGKPMIQWVYESIKKSALLSRFIIATDDKRIQQAAAGFGAEVFMTSAGHPSGTDRVAEVAGQLDTPIVINIQGDEPLVQGKMIDALVEVLQDDSIPIASLMARRTDLGGMQDPNRVKVVVDERGYALYFSRSAVPFGAKDFYFLHLGIYGYQKDFLRELVRMRASRLETAERLEQLRILEAGFKIKMVEVPYSALSVDTPEDIIKVEEFLKRNKHE
jgi:3-deoxy-manno-octulosonate cytidylyltransferase (CMP-KDO synthetase)